MSLQERKDEVGRLVAAGDLHRALQLLNGMTPHRFTGMYRFAGPTVGNMLGVDKLDPSVQRLSDVPVSASYCAFTGRLDRPFGFSDSFDEESVKDHLSREQVRAYCGVPLRAPDGIVMGTVCHWDYDATPISEEAVELLEHFSAKVATSIQHLMR